MAKKDALDILDKCELTLKSIFPNGKMIYKVTNKEKGVYLELEITDNGAILKDKIALESYDVADLEDIKLKVREKLRPHKEEIIENDISLEEIKEKLGIKKDKNV